MKNFFYILKPIIPRAVQLFLRRMLVERQRVKYKDVWPILHSAAKKPSNWQGWPDGKKFAFIITHDVELRNGHDKCKQLILVEKNLGFVSSFNFVPERYNVSPKLREYIEARGFEVGVHGLNHDGKLFSNENVFSERAKKINNYIKQWNSVGFRAPAMHHNLKWLHKLDLKYDLSTFDTDPFEPQADGMKTIFPFWVPKNDNVNASGYWEFPYTLVQDFTLFILMKENDICIWKEKIDWIVDNGGMVLVNVHPDYVNFNGKLKKEEFHVSLYIDLLEYIKNKYNKEYWNPLPKELAKYLDQHFDKNLAVL